jgi:hypothetical protein
LQNHIFTNTEQKYMMLQPFEREMFAVSLVMLNALDVHPTRVELPLNCYIAQITGHTNYARSVRQPFTSNSGLRLSHEIAVVTIGPFQMLVHCVIDTNFMILRNFLLKL